MLLEALVHASDAQLAQACKYQDASLPAKFVKRPSYKQLTSLDIVSEVRQGPLEHAPIFCC